MQSVIEYICSGLKKCMRNQNWFCKWLQEITFYMKEGISNRHLRNTKYIYTFFQRTNEMKHEQAITVCIKTENFKA